MEQLETDSSYRDSVASHYAEHLRYLSTLDSVYRHDSVSVHSAKCRVQSGACVDTLYVERWHTYYKYRDRAVHDTINRTDTVTKTQTITKTITKTIKSPPQRYVPRFYKWCAAILALLILAIVLYVFLRIYLRR